MTRQNKTLEFETANRSGFTLLEVSVAGVVLVLLMAITVQVLGWVAGERRAAERRQWANQEASNVMDRLSSQPWETLSNEAAMNGELSPQLRDVLPEGELKVEVTSEPRPPEAKRLVVEVRWQSSPGQLVAPVRLTSWVYRRGGAGE